MPAGKHFTAAEDGLSREWHGRVYMNPPYGAACRGSRSVDHAVHGRWNVVTAKCRDNVTKLPSLAELNFSPATAGDHEEFVSDRVDGNPLRLESTDVGQEVLGRGERE